MCDQDHFEDDRQEYEARGLVTRRQFGVLVGAGVAMMLPKVVNAVAVTESDVTITTPDGTCDCYFVHPATGTAAAVLVWPDIFGLRPGVPADGQAACRVRLLRAGREPVLPDEEGADCRRTAPRRRSPQVIPLAQALNETTHMTDAKAFIAWLDQQPAVAKNRKIGTQGYCMGGPMAFRTAAAVPDRVGAVASFHGGGLVTNAPNSPHLQASKTKAQFLVAIAENDDQRRRREGRAETDVRQGEPARGDRGLRRCGARLVPARLGCLQRAAGRKGVDPAAGAVRQGAGVKAGVSWRKNRRCREIPGTAVLSRDESGRCLQWRSRCPTVHPST